MIQLATPPSSVEPLLFGPPNAPLYGCYHAARGSRESRPRHAVLICQPVGHESIRCHRCLRNLAGRLAAGGVATLRFDYYGCGDSAGDAEDATLAAWLMSVRLAATQLRHLSGADDVVVVGLRMGAALAALASAEKPLCDRLVLWEPIASGRAFLDQCRALHDRHVAWVTKEFGAPPGGATDEVLGYRWSPRLLREVGEINLESLRQIPAREVLIVDNAAAAPALEPLRARLASLGATATLVHEPEPGAWDAEPHLAALPHASLNRIFRWLMEATP